MKAFKKTISILLVMAICLLSLPMSLFANAETTKMIYQIHPGKTGQTVGQDVSSSASFVGNPGYKTYVREDADGLYYSTEVPTFTGEKYIYFDSGWTSTTLPLLGNKDVLNKLLTYMQVSLDIRIVSDTAIDSDIGVAVLSYPDANNILRYTNGTVNVTPDGEWHTFTRSGAAGSLTGTYLNKILIITKNIPADLKIEIRNFSVSLKESDKDAINTALDGTGYTYDTLTSYVPYGSVDYSQYDPDKNYTISQIEPGRTGQAVDSNVSTSGLTGASTYQTYVREDDDGYYYSTQVAASSGGSYSYFSHGWTQSNMPALTNTVLNKIKNYMTVSYDVRVKSDSALSGVFKLRIDSYNSGSNFAVFSPWQEITDNEWHHYEAIVNTAALSAFAPSICLLTNNSANAVPVELQIRNFTFSLKGSDAEAIDIALAGTGYTFESLISYIPFNYDPNSYMIGQIEPGRTGQAVDSNVSTSGLTGASTYQTYVREDDDGYYYSTQVAASSGGSYSYFKHGWTGDNMPVLTNTVLNKIRKYVTLSYDVRVKSDSALSGAFKLRIDSYNSGSNFAVLAPWQEITDNEWHHYEAIVDTAALSAFAPSICLITNNSANAVPVELQIRNITFSLIGSNSAAINEALAGTGYTFESLIKYYPYVHNSPKHNIWQATPEYFGVAEGTDVTTGKSTYAAALDTFVFDEAAGKYYSIDYNDAAATSKMAFMSTGWHNTKLAWLAEKEIINNLIPFMQISAEVRVNGYDPDTGDDAEATNVSFSLGGMNSYEITKGGGGFTMLKNVAVPGDGEWHTVTGTASGNPMYDLYNFVLYFSIKNPDGCTFEFDVKNVTISLKESDKAEINDTLAGIDSVYNNYDALVNFVSYYNLDTVIWYADSNKADKAMNNDGYVDVELGSDVQEWQMWSKYDTTAELDSDGAYYRTQMDVLGGGSDSANSLINSGVSRKNRGYGWMNNLEVLNALRPYMNVSLQYRVTGNVTSNNLQLTIRPANYSSFAVGTGLGISQFKIAGTENWYEKEYSPITTDFTNAWNNGYFSVSVYSSAGDLAGNQVIDIRGLNIAIASANREKINAALAEIEGIDNIPNFTAGLTLGTDENGNKDYFSLLSSSSNAPAFDVNDDESFDIKDLVAAKKYSSVYSYAPQYVLDRVDTDKNGNVGAVDLTGLRKDLINKATVRNDFVIGLAEDHPGVAEMDADYTLTISDKSGNALDTADFDWSANFDSVTFDGVVVTVPYAVRMSSKDLVVTAVSKENAELYATYTFDFQKFSAKAAFADEFEGDAIDSTKWTATTYETAGDIAVADGELKLTVDPDEVTGITTEGKYNQTFGSFSARVKLPTDGLTCSAFWLMNYGGYYTDPNYPNNTEGEIDIMEYLSETNCYMTSVHWNGYVEDDLYSKSCRFTDTALRDDNDPRFVEKPALNMNDGEYHIVSTVWTKEGIYWYVDGDLVFVHTGEGVGQGGGSMHMRFDLYGKVNDSFGGELDEADFPVDFAVDWVRVYVID